MAKHLYRVAINIPDRMREELLRLFPASLPNVLARSITWAYNVPADFSFSKEPATVEVYGIHRGPRTEAFLVRFGGEDYQANQPRHLHLTLATATGVPPAAAGEEIEMASVLHFPQPLTFSARLEAFPLWDMARIGKGRRKAA